MENPTVKFAIIGVAAFVIIAALVFGVVSLVSNQGGEATKSTALVKAVALKPPLLIINEPCTGLETDQRNMTFTGRTDPGVKVDLEGLKVDVNKDGTFAIGLMLVRGFNRFTVRAVNKEGAKAEAEISMNSYPPLPINAPAATTPTGTTGTLGLAARLIGHWRSTESSNGSTIEVDWYFDGTTMTSVGPSGQPTSFPYTTEVGETANELLLTVAEVNPVRAYFSDDFQKVQLNFERSGHGSFLTYVDGKTSP